MISSPCVGSLCIFLTSVGENGEKEKEITYLLVSSETDKLNALIVSSQFVNCYQESANGKSMTL